MQDLLLIFAYHFPPENAIGGLRPYRFSKYLGRLGIRAHTITAADVSTRPDLDAETVGDPFITSPREGLGWQAERAIRKFIAPGITGIQWARLACEAACKFVDSQKEPSRVTILSTFPPMGTAMAGYWLAKKRAYPWILDLRDPMGAPPGIAASNSIHGRTLRFLEKKFVSAADAVIANTDSAQAQLQKSMPHMAGKIGLIWNGFDPEKRLTAMPIPKRTQRVYSHTGELYEGRVMTPMLLAIERLIRNGRVSPESILVHQLGPVRWTSVPGEQFMAEAQEKGWLKVTAQQVPQAEAQRVMQESDGLLLVQPHSTLQVPGKLFEYVQIGRPVFAYVPVDTPIERILKESQTPHVCGYSSDSEQSLDKALERFFQLDTNSVAASEWFEHNFNAQNHAAQLAGLIRSSKVQPS